MIVSYGENLVSAGVAEVKCSRFTENQKPAVKDGETGRALANDK